MKKATLLTALIGLSFAGMAQSKKVYQPDLTKKVTLQVTVSALDLNNYMYVVQQGGPQAISASQTLTGDKITRFLKGFGAVADSLTNIPARSWLQFYKDGESKWTADTLKDSKTIKK